MNWNTLRRLMKYWEVVNFILKNKSALKQALKGILEAFKKLLAVLKQIAERTETKLDDDIIKDIEDGITRFEKWLDE